jgi:hypothetical protein
LDSQNLAYALTQIVHNFGAVAVVGGAVSALAWREADALRKLAWLVLFGWAVQASSGATLGAISFFYQGKFPEIGHTATVALGIKVVCAALGFCLAAWQLYARPSPASGRPAWIILIVLGVVALSSAAVLRWFS